MFFLVSGAAASGKSTVVKLISGQLENIECHDADVWHKRTSQMVKSMTNLLLIPPLIVEYRSGVLA